MRPKEREAILSVVARHRLRKLLVESRPEHIDSRKISGAAGILGKIWLEVAMGFETVDDAMRERLGKGFTLKDFERAAGILSESGAALGAYVLIKPVPMGEDEAQSDAIATLEYLAGLRTRAGVRISARLEPFTIYEGMDVEPGHTPVSPRTVMQIISNAPENLDIFLGWSESEATLSESVRGGIASELNGMKNAIDMFNSTGDRRAFEIR